MFRAVDTQRRDQHQHENNKHRRKDLGLFLPENICNHIKGIVGRVDLEQTEDTDDPQDPEADESGKEEERQYRQQVDNTVK